MTTKFEPGMLVALYETWPTQNIICLTLVRSVGKQQVRLDSSSQFHLDGRARTLVLAIRDVVWLLLRKPGVRSPRPPHDGVRA